MKHHRFLYRTLSALLCLGLCAQLTACGKKPVPKPGSSGAVRTIHVGEGL